MSYTFETEKGLVTISKHSITIDNKVYNICSEQLSCGEYETYVLQQIKHTTSHYITITIWNYNMQKKYYMKKYTIIAID